MDRKIRIAQYGCGKMSHYLMRYVLEKGGELVAAFDMNPAMIGTDIGTHLGMEKLGITISDAKDASEILSKEKPDVCIIATRSTMAELKEAFSVCAQNGINAISTCEEALYPWNSSKEITEELKNKIFGFSNELVEKMFPFLKNNSVLFTTFPLLL